MSTRATVIAFPTTASLSEIAGFGASNEGEQSATSPEALVKTLVEDSEIRSHITSQYTQYFTSKQSLRKHWLSILTEHGHEETERRLRRIVSEFIYQQTEDETVARAYHAHCGKLFNIFIDSLTSHLLKAIQATHTA